MSETMRPCPFCGSAECDGREVVDGMEYPRCKRCRRRWASRRVGWVTYWRRLAEEKPVDAQVCQVSDCVGVRVATYDAEAGTFRCGGWPCSATHWLPMPAPPDEDTP